MKVPKTEKLVEVFSDVWDKLENVPGLPEEQTHEDRANLIRRIAHATTMPKDGGRMGTKDQLRELIDRHCPMTERYHRSCHGNPFTTEIWRVTMALHAINDLMGGFGVEAFGSKRRGDYAPSFEYINYGDPYETTLIYQRSFDVLRIACWGDIAEKAAS